MRKMFKIKLPKGKALIFGINSTPYTLGKSIGLNLSFFKNRIVLYLGLILFDIFLEVAYIKKRVENE